MADDLATIGFKADTTGLTQLNKGLTTVGNTSQATEKKMVASNKAIAGSFMTARSAIVSFSAVIGAISVVSGFKSVINVTKDFNREISALSAITGAVGKDLEYFKEQALAIGSATTLSASEAAVAFKLIASAKPDLLASAEALTAVTKEAVALAEASGVTLPEAANVLGTSLNQFQLGADKASEAINILAAASKFGAAEVPLVAEALVNVGSAANAVGLDLAETVAGIESLAAAGIKGAEGGTALRQVLLKLEGTADKKLMPSVVGLVDSLDELASRNLNNTQLIKMFGEEAFKSATALITQKDSLGTLNVALRDTETAYEQAAIAQDNLDGDLKKLGSTIEGISLAIGGGMDSALRGMTQGLNDALSDVDALTDAVEAAALVVGVGMTPVMYKYTASLVAAGTAQLTAGTQAVVMSSGIKLATSSTVAATVATNALGMATKFLLGPWGLLLTAIGTAATAFTMAKDSNDALNGSLATQKERVEDLITVYSAMSNMQLGNTAIEARKQQIELDRKILDLQDKIAAASQANPDSITGISGAAQIGSLRKELSELLDQKEKLNQLQGALVQVFNGKLPNAWKEVIAETSTVAKTSIDKVSIALNGLEYQYAVYGQALSEVKDFEAQSIEQRKQWIQATIDAADPTIRLKNEIEKLNNAMAGGEISNDIGTERIKQLQEQIDQIKPPVDVFGTMTDGAKEALSAVQGLSAQGSKDYKKLGIAIQAVSAAQAIFNVLNQGSGDPYSAFGRMAAMAAAVAALGFSVASINDGGNETTSVQNQASQGLNEFGEKAESIANAVDITATATDKLVGINTNMLKALQSLQVALGGAANMISRDASIPSLSVDTGQVGRLDSALRFDPLAGTSLSFLGDFVGGAIASFLGGSSRTEDEGIKIIGGTIGNLMDNVVTQGFKEVSYKKWRFGSRKYKTTFANLGDAVNNQFELVFGSLADSVSAGAVGLGMEQSAVDKAINDFVIGTITISMKGMSAGQKTDAIENVFSQIFNNLTRSVVPWISQFQKAGEELGETIARVSTEVSIADLIVERFGVTFGDKIANPEMYAKAADNLTNLVGGIEELANATSDFIGNFAPEAVQLSIYSDSLTASLESVGLALPNASSGMWELMQGLDATTEAGANQIATLLNLQDTASSYYKMLEKQNEAYASISDKFANAITNMYNLGDAVSSVGLDAALAAARAGDFSLAEKLNPAGPSASDFSTYAEFAIAQSKAAGKFLEISELAAKEGNVQDQQLDVLKKINENIAKQSQSTNTASKDESDISTKQLAEDTKYNTEAIAKLTVNTNKLLNQILNNGIPVAN